MTPGKLIGVSYISSTKISSMRMAFNTRISKEWLSDQEDLTAIVSNSFKLEKRRLLTRKSIRVFNLQFQLFEQDRDNIVRNLITCVFRFDGYKVPRIVKKLLRA
jgi:hypothetical protein